MEKEFEQKLTELVDDIFAAATDAWDWGWGKLAAEAGTCYSTVARLGYRQTKSPHLRTIFKLSRAVGMDIKLVKQSLKVAKSA